MNLDKYFEILHRAEQLKNNTRHSWTSSGRHESVAEHSWRLALMAYFMKDAFPGMDMNKVILMCLFSRSFFADSSYMLSFSVLCSCVCSRLISPSVSSWHKQDNTLMHQSPGHIQRRTPYNF